MTAPRHIMALMKRREMHLKAMLRSVNRAIRDALAAGSQSATISIDGSTQSVQRYSLDHLRQIRADLMRELALLEGSARMRVIRGYE